MATARLHSCDKVIIVEIWRKNATNQQFTGGGGGKTDKKKKHIDYTRTCIATIVCFLLLLP